MNLLIALVLLFIGFFAFHDERSQRPALAGHRRAARGVPAAVAGLQAGDRIVARSTASRRHFDDVRHDRPRTSPGQTRAARRSSATAQHDSSSHVTLADRNPGTGERDRLPRGRAGRRRHATWSRNVPEARAALVHGVRHPRSAARSSGIGRDLQPVGPRPAVADGDRPSARTTRRSGPARSSASCGSAAGRPTAAGRLLCLLGARQHRPRPVQPAARCCRSTAATS